VGDPGGNQFVLPLDLLIKTDFFPLNFVGKFRFLFLEFLGELLLQGFDGFDKFLQTVIHRGPENVVFLVVGKGMVFPSLKAARFAIIYCIVMNGS
jgi:hypothetical protein